MALFYPFRSSIYMIPGGTTPGGVDLGGGREVWKGLFTSAHVAQNNRLLVNMDGILAFLYFKMCFLFFLFVPIIFMF